MYTVSQVGAYFSLPDLCTRRQQIRPLRFRVIEIGVTRRHGTLIIAEEAKLMVTGQDRLGQVGRSDNGAAVVQKIQFA